MMFAMYANPNYSNVLRRGSCGSGDGTGDGGVRDRKVTKSPISRKPASFRAYQYARKRPQPGGRKKVAHGASHGSAPFRPQPRNGAEDRSARNVLRPVPGLGSSPSSPTAHAMGYFLSPLRGLRAHPALERAPYFHVMPAPRCFSSPTGRGRRSSSCRPGTSSWRGAVAIGDKPCQDRAAGAAFSTSGRRNRKRRRRGERWC